MCKPSHSSPAPFARKRSSFSSTSSSDSSRSSATANGLPKRVSFSERVEVYRLEPIGNDVIGEVFYCPADYRRFRSDSCLELLDQQLQAHKARNPWNLFFQRWMSSMAERNQARRRQKQQSKLQAELPWLTPYHPHEEQSQELSPGVATAPLVRSEAFQYPTRPSGEDIKEPYMPARERLLIQELAFDG